MKIRLVVLLLGVAFFAGLGVVVGQRLSAEAMAVVIGVVAGVLASIPTSLLVVWVVLRAAPRPVEPPSAPAPSPAPAPAEPPRVVVMSQPTMPYPYPLSNAYQQSAYTAPPPALATAHERQFNVIGGETLAEPEPSQEMTSWPR